MSEIARREGALDHDGGEYRFTVTAIAVDGGNVVTNLSFNGVACDRVTSLSCEQLEALRVEAVGSAESWSRLARAAEGAIAPLNAVVVSWLPPRWEFDRESVRWEWNLGSEWDDAEWADAYHYDANQEAIYGYEPGRPIECVGGPLIAQPVSRLVSSDHDSGGLV